MATPTEPRDQRDDIGRGPGRRPGMSVGRDRSRCAGVGAVAQPPAAHSRRAPPAYACETVKAMGAALRGKIRASLDKLIGTAGLAFRKPLAGSVHGMRKRVIENGPRSAETDPVAVRAQGIAECRDADLYALVQETF